MPLEAKKHLEDMRRAAELILRFTSGKQRAEYSDDDLLRSAVELLCKIVGEALSCLRRG